jgi:uncharacterized cupin superfamily protein
MEEIMPKIFRKEKLEFQKKPSRVPEYEWNVSPRLGRLVNSKYLEFYVVSLDAGKYSFPYHYHRAAEELFMVISGDATLRTPEGFHPVSQGDIIFFEEGSTGAHQLYNHSDSPCVYLDLRTTVGVDVCEYPDSQKINILPFMEVFERVSKVDYYKGEEEPASKWPEEIVKNRKKSS